MGTGWGKSSEVQVVGCISRTQQAPTIPVPALPQQHCIVEFIVAELTSSSEGLVYKCLYMKNNFSSSSVSLSLCGFQLQTLGKFFASETPLIEVALCQQYLALWVMAGIFRSVQVRRLGAQSLFCLVNSFFLAHQLLCKATDAQCRQFLLARNLREITDNLMAQSFLFL